MKARGRKKQKRLLRRCTAVGTAIAATMLICRTADIGAAKNALFSSEKVVKKLLEMELGKVEEEDGLDGWTELVVSQSPMLSSEKEAVSGYLRELAVMQAEESVTEEEPEPEEPAVEEPVEEESEEPTEEPEETAQETAKPVPLDLGGISPDDIEIVNNTEGKTLKIEKYWKKSPSFTFEDKEKGPQILIMHTHATEAYTMADGDDYEESDESRTTDENFNMIRVGEEMKAVFEEQGFSVIHDKTTYDYPGYNGSYGRSLAGVQEYLDEYPSIQMVLDVHRDALIDAEGNIFSKTTTIDGERVAQVMLVVGTDDGGLTHPDWRDNYTLALKIQGAMLASDKTFPRPIDLRSQRFNQHLRHGSLLVEVGTSGNTLREALAGARRFATATSMVLNHFN